MFKLSENWITEGLMDVEYKQYLLLAYLRDIHEVFNNKILYPPFAELIEHHRNLKTIKKNLQQIKSSEKELKGIDWQNYQLIYQTPENTETEIIEEIINFSIPKIEQEIQHGKEVFEEVEKKLKYTTVGLVPLHKDVGFFFVQNYPTSDFLVYKYEVSSFYTQSQDNKTAYKKLQTEYIATYTLNLSKSLTSIKQEVLKQSPTPFSPAVYSFFPNQAASMEYTILPIVKRVLMKLVA